MDQDCTNRLNRRSIGRPDCMNAQSQDELWDAVAHHLERIVRRRWRRQVASKLGGGEEAFVRNATRQIFDSLTMPLRTTVTVGCDLQNTIASPVSTARAGRCELRG